MLKNEYLDAKIGVDTAENEHPEEWYVLHLWHARSLEHDAPPGGGAPGDKRCGSGCSFSALATPILASKYAFFSIFRDLQNNLAEFTKFCKIVSKIQQRFEKIRE